VIRDKPLLSEVTLTVIQDDLTFLIVDIGEVITKAILIEKSDNRHKVKDLGKTSTTVELPHLDVTIGVVNVIQEIEKATGHRLLSQGEIITPKGKDGAGVDLFLCTSSTGGGLQMIVSGVMSTITAESARRAVLGAGALLLDIFSIDDERMPYEKIERVRRLKPDIFLLAGGTDGGQVNQVVGSAELVARADPKPRFGAEFKLPIIYAGNIDARIGVKKALENGFALKMVENIRPSIEVENLGPAREAIYDDFMEHVIIHQPGYDKLAKWTKIPIMPTQAAIGEMIHTIAKHYDQEVLGVDVEEATIDTYSVFKGVFNRSLDANFGMGYGICNILKQAGVERILQWIPFEIEENELRNIIANRMVHMQDTAETAKDLLIEQAVAREGMRLALENHKNLAVRLRGLHRQVRSVDEHLFPRPETRTLVNMMDLDLLIGMGMLTRAKPEQAALMLIDAFQPEGITELTIDKMGILPHIAMLQRIDQNAAIEVLEDEGLLRLGTCIAPKGVADEGEEVLRIRMKSSDENVIEKDITFGELEVIPLENGKQAEIEILLARKSFDVGKGEGKSLTAIVKGGPVGLIIDARGRPISIPKDKEKRLTKLAEWGKALSALPEDLGIVQSVKRE
jgi:hypothetical protein